jgi:hypothetical protein
MLETYTRPCAREQVRRAGFAAAVGDPGYAADSDSASALAGVDPDDARPPHARPARAAQPGAGPAPGLSARLEDALPDAAAAPQDGSGTASPDAAPARDAGPGGLPGAGTDAGAAADGGGGPAAPGVGQPHGTQGSLLDTAAAAGGGESGAAGGRPGEQADPAHDLFAGLSFSGV